MYDGGVHPQESLSLSIIIDYLLIDWSFPVLGYQQSNCNGTGVIVSSTDPNTCVSASPQNGNETYFQSFMLKNCP